jgi:hypothetical protein
MDASTAMPDLSSQLKELKRKMNLSAPSSNFPTEDFESLQQAKRRLAALVNESAERRKSQIKMLRFYMAYPEKGEQLMTENNALENLEHKIGILQCFLDSNLTEKTFSKEIAILVSELYNQLNYAVCEASGPEAVNIKVSFARMVEATAGQSACVQRFCLGDDIFDDDMSELGCSLSDGYPSDDDL